MTVVELKKALENVGDDIEVRVGDIVGHYEIIGILGFEDKHCLMLPNSLAVTEAQNHPDVCKMCEVTCKECGG